MDLLTIPEVLRRITEEDKNTSITRGFIYQLIENGELDYEERGNRIMIDYDDLPRCLCQIFNCQDRAKLPRIRTIMSAVLEIKKTYPKVHIGENRLRSLVAEDIVPCIYIGNRAYLAVESIDNYIAHWHDINKSRKQMKKDKINENIALQLEKINFQRKIKFSRR